MKKRNKNIPNQIFSIKLTKRNLPNQFFQTKYRETKCTENQRKVQTQLELSLAQLSPSLYSTFVQTSITLGHHTVSKDFSPLSWPIWGIKKRQKWIRCTGIFNFVRKLLLVFLATPLRGIVLTWAVSICIPSWHVNVFVGKLCF